MSISWPLEDKLAVLSQHTLIFRDSRDVDCPEGSMNMLRLSIDYFAERYELLRSTLPWMVNVALQTRIIFPRGPLSLLSPEVPSQTLSSLQIACILSNAFLCTFPTGANFNWKEIYFDTHAESRSQAPDDYAKVHKLMCLFNYFQNIRPRTDLETRFVTFFLKSIKSADLPNWRHLNLKFDHVRLRVLIDSECIEDQGSDFVQLDFANKNIGGGVLRSGCVQEEIRFMICPELIVSLLISGKLKNRQALLVKGAERFSKYTGYGRASFRCDGRFDDKTPRDNQSRIETIVLAVDAAHYKQSNSRYRQLSKGFNSQLQAQMIIRELDKFYVGVLDTELTAGKGIATGNWGCGAFGGSSQLKALIQLMAIAAATPLSSTRRVIYCTFDDRALEFDTPTPQLGPSLYQMMKIIKNAGVDVSDLMRYIELYRQMLQSFSESKTPRQAPDLFTFLMGELELIS